MSNNIKTPFFKRKHIWNNGLVCLCCGLTRTIDDKQYIHANSIISTRRWITYYMNGTKLSKNPGCKNINKLNKRLSILNNITIKI